MKKRIRKTKIKITPRRFSETLILGLILILIPLINVKATTISELNQQISEKRQEVEKIGSKIESLEADIATKKEQSASLSNQISILNIEIQKTEKEIEKTSKEIEETNLEIQTVQLQIKKKEQAIEKQRDILTEFIWVLYKYDQKNPVEILLGYDSLSDFMDQVEYLKLFQNKVKAVLDKLQDLKKELEWKNTELNSKKSELEDLKVRLKQEKERLSLEKYGRTRLLEITKKEEIKYQELLQKAREEYEKVNAEIAATQKELQKKLEEARKRKQNTRGGPIKGAVSFIWPVDPSLGISAYFMDPSYYAYFGVRHYAIDIRCPQGTPIKASADALVIKTRNAGYGYSYIMLLHTDEIATVYGHISAFNVTEGQYVKQGDIIGYSGGTPGTLGAGWLTTGPHLHFEVRVNGSPVDPLGYLP